MTLEQAIEYCRNACDGLSDNVECNECRAEHEELLAYLEELREWRESPFAMMKRHCERSGKCGACDWFNKGCHYLNTIPEDFKL